MFLRGHVPPGACSSGGMFLQGHVPPGHVSPGALFLRGGIVRSTLLGAGALIVSAIFLGL